MHSPLLKVREEGFGDTHHYPYHWTLIGKILSIISHFNFLLKWGIFSGLFSLRLNLLILCTTAPCVYFLFFLGTTHLNTFLTLLGSFWRNTRSDNWTGLYFSTQIWNPRGLQDTSVILALVIKMCCFFFLHIKLLKFCETSINPIQHQIAKLIITKSF